ncbi:hypothetical protein MKS88_003471 [Plasmodium brasilianum]|uniref:Uncharacterized protein n=1 Tax=Plasmodium brasilianum TaxID=5824 RepID=A0ACB9Y838_PLABR|nr:hypothetical protein MKS88_003471 [Plasmodium brasilianum]
MEKQINIQIFIKISTFVLIFWNSNFYNVSGFNKSLNENYIIDRKIGTRFYRLLGKYKPNKNSSILELREKIPNDGVNEKVDICNNEKGKTGLNNKLSENWLKNVKGRNLTMKNKSCIFETKKYSSIEKKIFKELDYEDFLKNNKTISGKIYKKIILKKYGLRIALPIILFLLLITVLVLDLSWGLLKEESIWKAIGLGKDQLKELETPLSFILDPLSKLEFFKHNTFGGATAGCSLCTGATASGLKVSKTCILGQLFGLLIYVIPFIILGVTVISAIFFYHKKVKKYEKIKFKKQ